MAGAAGRRLLGVTFFLSLMIGATYGIEPLHSLQPWKRAEGYVPFWNVVGRHWLGEEEQLLQEQEALEALRLASLDVPPEPEVSPARPEPEPVPVPEGALFPPYEPQPGEEDELKVMLEDAERLDSYYRRLALVDLKAPVLARAAHWGDSLLGDDGLTAGIRRRLQARFGDGGHGFHVLQPGNPFHMHRDIRFKVHKPWMSSCQVLFRCEKDNRYGLGGVSTRAHVDAVTRFGTTKEAPGDRISRFELWYEAGPGNGLFEVRIDDEEPRRVDTRAEERSDERAVFELEDGPHSIEVRAAGRGAVRGYGVVLERGGPGVVWDNLAIIGISAMSLHAQEIEHIRGQVALRELDLLVFGLSGNDSQRSLQDLRAKFADDYTTVLARYRAGRPDAACLLVSVTDHGEQTEEGQIRTRRSIPELVALQRQVAQAQGCAFFDLFEAMGGRGTIARWTRSKPALAGADLAHPTSAGHRVLATLIYRAVQHGYVQFRQRMAGEPFPEWEEFR